ncbi:hypothetical protein C1645_875630 [Glomus cerebriforme]|uniref:Uncharacterized protein n=1 Tax=Glomus cerebriforme TaxID=658196 RepID=A0A397T1F7_9GLOM|nr:hypothetical protein C1645_875630 [Glomus cerebriforme]
MFIKKQVIKNRMEKQRYAKMQEKEFYSKVCVAGSIKFVVDKAIEEDIDLLNSNKFSCNIATILAVVAVNLKILPKYAPMSFEQAHKRNDVKELNLLY